MQKFLVKSVAVTISLSCFIGAATLAVTGMVILNAKVIK
jgi:hypothetical protein